MRLFIIIKIFILSAGFMFSAYASDIYFYKDESGTLNFTNTPESNKAYKLFMRDTLKKWRPSVSMYSPDAFDELINEASKEYDIDSTLIKAIIKAESDFNPWAISPKGARGLMQIMPDNFNSLGIKNPFDPRQNIMAGTLYIKQMIQKFENLPMALAAYNAGPNVVSNYQGIPPYQETQTYIRRVLKYYRQYSDRY